MKNKIVALRVKIKSLAEEAGLIRLEERRAKRRGSSRLLHSLQEHRRGVVRAEARASLLAYGFLRGRPYWAVEATRGSEPDWDYVGKLVRKFGAVSDWSSDGMGSDISTAIQDYQNRLHAQEVGWGAWVEAAKAARVLKGQATHGQSLTLSG